MSQVFKRRQLPISGQTVIAVVLFLVLLAIPFNVSGYPIYILPQYMLFGVLAMSLSLLWGYVGIVSFGQAAFFALGAYGIGLTLKNIHSASAIYLGLLIAIAVGFILAAAIGYFLFSAGVRETYFVLATLAISTIVEALGISQSQITGGFNGMYIPRAALPFPGGAIALSGDHTIYFLVLGVTCVVYTLLSLLLASKFGWVLIAIREHEDRTLSLGFDTPRYKTLAFGVAGLVAALAGALYGLHAGFVTPSLAGVTFSTEVVVWVAIGGPRHLVGSLVAGIVISVIANYLNASIPEYWQLILGLVFVAVIVSRHRTFARRFSRHKDGRQAAPAELTDASVS